MDQPARFEVNLDEAIYALSGGLDLVGIDDVQHGKRVAFMALETARPFGWDGATLRDLYHASLIHDLGVSSTEVHRHLVSEMEWENAEQHCELDADLLRRFRPLAHLADLLLYHHTHWDQLKSGPLPEHDALLANLIFLCDRVDALRAQHLLAGGTEPSAHVRGLIPQYRDSFFHPQLVDCFMEVSQAPLFWERLFPRPLEEYLTKTYPPDPARTIGLADIRDLARLFAHIVDAKSPYTARHSEGVAQLSCYLAQRLGLRDEELEILDVAALLHDLGKLRVPDRILDKPAPLDASERQIMYRHPLDSFSILDQIEGFDQVAKWAGLHHETPCGDGYPDTFRREALPLQSRIISAADVFQALAQDRPYRPALPPKTILSVLQQEAERGHLDRAIVALIADNLEACWQAATVPLEGRCPGRWEAADPSSRAPGP